MSSNYFRVLFLSFDYLRPKDPNISLATASIISYLKKQLPILKPNVELKHLRLNVCNGSPINTTSQVIEKVKAVNPHVIATGVYVWNEVFVSHAFQTLFRNFDDCTKRPFVVFGGPQITYANKGTLEECYPIANAFIRGYAEQSMLQLIVSLSNSQMDLIDGVHYRTRNDSGSKSKFILGSLPSPLLSGDTKQTGFIRMETKRGCNFKCRFCQHRDTYNIDKRESCSLERIEKEIDWIVKHDVNDISIVDPIFNTPSSHYIEVMDYFIKYNYKGRLNLQSRLEMVNSDYIDRCNRLMANGVEVELEFGIQTVIKDEMKVIDRPQSLKLLIQKAESVRFNSIPFEISLIYGLPQQTVDSFKHSLLFVRESLRPNRVRAWPLMLLRGTKMFDMKAEFGLREKVLNDELEGVDDMRIYNGIPHVISSSSFSENDWNIMKAIACDLNNENGL